MWLSSSCKVKRSYPKKGISFSRRPCSGGRRSWFDAKKRGLDDGRRDLSALRRFFPFKQRFRPQVFAVQPQQLERIKNGFGLAVEQLIEPTNPILIQTDNLAIEDGVLHWQFG